MKLVNLLSCLKCLHKQVEDIKGHDPRTWCEDILISMIRSGKISAKKFKKQLVKKIKKEIKDFSDPEAYAERMWKKIKKKCS